MEKAVYPAVHKLPPISPWNSFERSYYIRYTPIYQADFVAAALFIAARGAAELSREFPPVGGKNDLRVLPRADFRFAALRPAGLFSRP
ncbi:MULTISPECIES: hypothetical protein [Anaerotruncus]|uniref:Uncharacterized protein n=1 Tax=Anaerotruncus massiliensis (ex Togo et al. 2019) TaxID=1673720 RepID=A0ABR7AFQ9_9FIRM|nr:MULTISPECIES: hypothetical protein [Anaerotruncus]MBC3939275.1 hypothetical protein [Anaerotruncus massiliensis (ex Togo et al. 2019)]